MSVLISGNNINLTRGDSLIVHVAMLRNNEPFTPSSEDSIRFAMGKDRKGLSYPLIIKQIDPDDMILKLEPEDTKSLDYGTYYYDIEYTSSDGYVDTFIGPAPFKLTEEVY